MGNNCTFDGRLGKDAEPFSTNNGTNGIRFPLANDIGYGQNKKTQWVSCTIWGKRAESLEPYLKRGARIIAFGEVSLNEWTNRDGVTQTSLALNCSDVWLVARPSDQAGQAPAASRSAPPQQARRAPAPAQQSLSGGYPGDVSFDDDDIAF